MNNKICVITGCNTGIGKVTAIELAKVGYEILMLVRDSDKSRTAYQAIKQESKSDRVKLYYVDLSSIDSIKSVVWEIKNDCTKLDVLINNAAVYKRTEKILPNGYEMTFGVNYIAPFLLSRMLLPLLRKAEKARIINLSSEMYKRGEVHLKNNFKENKFNGNKVYANSKLLITYFTKELAKRLLSTDVTVNCVHPGVVGTDVFREFPKWFDSLLKIFIAKPDEGAKPTIYLATSEEVNAVSGKYFYKTKQKETDKVANDEKLSQLIWDKTEEMIISARQENNIFP